jgi:hypothetical protein
MPDQVIDVPPKVPLALDEGISQGFATRYDYVGGGVSLVFDPDLRAATVSVPGGGVGGGYSAGVSNLGNTAGTTGMASDRLVLVGGNNITLSQSLLGGSATVTIDGAAGGGGTGSISAGTTRATLGEVVFSNSNNVSFGVNGQTVTASYTAPVVSNAIQSVGSATGSGTNTSRFAADDHVHAGVFSMGVSTGGNTVGDTRVDVGRFVLVGGNNVTLSQATAAGALNTITISARPAYSAGMSTLGNTSGDTGFGSDRLVLAGINQISLSGSTNAGSMTISISGRTPGGFAIGGNTTGTSIIVTSGTLTLAGGNNITLSQANGSAVTISGPNQFTGGFSTGGNTLGDTGLVTGRLVLAGGPNITLSGSTDAGSITVSISGGAGAAGNTGSISAGTTRATLGEVVFSNSNNVSFGVNGQTVTASYTAPVVSNAIQSVGSATGSGTNTSRFAADDHVHAGVFSMGVSTGGNTLGDTRVDVGRFVLVGGANITLSQGTAAGALNTITISGAAGGAGNTGSISAGTTRATLGEVIFSNSNGVSFGVNGQTVTGSIATSLTNIRLSAGTTSNLRSDFTFNNANNVSFGLDAGTITGSVATSLTNIRVSAGTTSNLLSAITFADGNGLSFGLNASTITVSYTRPVVSNAIQSVGTATGSGTNTSRFAADDHVHAGQYGWDVNGVASTFIGTQQLSAGNNMSIATGGNTTRGSAQIINLLSSGGAIQDVNTATSSGTGASIFARHDHVHRGVAGIDFQGIASTFYGTFQLSAGANMSLASGGNSTRGSAQIINLLSSATTVSAVGSANVIGTRASRFALEDHEHLGVFSAGVSNDAGNSAGDTGVRPGRWVFRGGNNITLSQITAAGSLQTIVVSAPNLGAGAFSGGASTLGNTSGSTGITGTRLIFAGINNITLSQSTDANGGTLSISGYTPGGVVIGGNTTGTTASITSGTMTIAGGNNITVSQAGGNAITISAGAGGAAERTISFWDNIAGAGSSGTINMATRPLANATLMIFPLDAVDRYFPGRITANTAQLNVSLSGSTATLSAAHTTSFSFGIYTRANGSQLSLLNSVSTSFGNVADAANSTIAQGQRWLTIHSSQWSSEPVFSEGVVYYGGLWIRSSNTAAQTFGMIGAFPYSTASRSGTIGVNSASATSRGFSPFLGFYSVSFSSAMPGSIGMSQLNKNAASANFMPHVVFNALTDIY